MKENIMQVIDYIQSDIHFTGLSDTLNYGGCGIFAYYLSLALKQYGIPYEIRAEVSGHSEDWQQKKEEVTVAALEGRLLGLNYLPETSLDWEMTENNSYVGHSCKHCAVYIPDVDYTVDGEGVTEGKWGTEYYTLEELRVAVATPNGWNPCFDRTYIPLVEKIINENFAMFADVEI